MIRSRKNLQSTTLVFVVVLVALLRCEVAFSSSLRVRQETEPKQPVVGVPFQLSLILEGENTSELVPDENFLRDNQTTWTRTAKPITLQVRGKATRLAVELIGLAAGRQPLPPLTVRSKQGVREEIPLLPIEIRSHLSPDELTTVPFALKLAEPAGTLLPPPVVKALPYALLAFALVALALLLVALWRWRRQLQEKAKAPLPPDLAALEELQQLENEGLIAKRQFKEFYSRLSDTVRVFLGKVFGFDGLECTTSELVRELEDKPVPPSLEREILSLLEEADLVKFAKYRPDPVTAERALERARAIVRQTPFIAPAAEGNPASQGGQQ